MNRFRAALATVVLVCLTAFGSQAVAHATPTERYPIDPAAQAASQVYPGAPSSAQARSAAAVAFVGVPSNYVYNTNLELHRVQHRAEN